jgi:hypothetical protein
VSAIKSEYADQKFHISSKNSSKKDSEGRPEPSPEALTKYVDNVIFKFDDRANGKRW